MSLMKTASLSGVEYQKPRRKVDKVVFVRTSKCPRMRLRSWNVFLVASLCAVFTIFLLSQIWSHSTLSGSARVRRYFNIFNSPSIPVAENGSVPKSRDLKCRMHSCFDVYRCNYNENTFISVYMYPMGRFVDSVKYEKVLHRKPTKEFLELFTAVRESSYYTDDVNKACIIIPGIDTLNQNALDPKATARILASLPRYVHVFIAIITE